MLLVPLSKMMLRDLVKIELVLPFTDSLGEFRTQAEPVEAVEANIGDPFRDIISVTLFRENYIA